MGQGPSIDPTDMKGNQQDLLGVSSVDVSQQYQNTIDSVTNGVPDNAVDTSVNQSFVDSAPNLPFKLPFGLDKLFHRVKQS